MGRKQEPVELSLTLVLGDRVISYRETGTSLDEISTKWPKMLARARKEYRPLELSDDEEEEPYNGVEMIISGGQTGADQAGLKVAKELGLITGGYAPKGYRTEKGSSPFLGKKYGLTEHSSPNYPPRTKVNAISADGTVWFGRTSTPGFHCTRKAVGTRPWIENPSVEQLRRWLIQHRITVLNVAGNSASKNPNIVQQVETVLSGALRT